MWELDLVIRHPAIGNEEIDETFLTNLFYFAEARKRIGTQASVEQVSALFGELSGETRFTKLHEKRADGLYQNLFLNPKLIRPLDIAFEFGKVDVAAPTVEQISGHRSTVLAALGIRETDLRLFQEWSDLAGTTYTTDDLTLENLSFLWRQAWLSRQLGYKSEDWKALLAVLDQDVVGFAGPKALVEFLERVDLLKSSGFAPDQLLWLLAADRSAKSATKESDAAKFLIGSARSCRQSRRTTTRRTTTSSPLQRPQARSNCSPC